MTTVASRKSSRALLYARQLKMIVYPSLFAFILLSSYGFYLIYNLSNDVRTLAADIAGMAKSVDSNMSVIATNMTRITESVDGNMSEIASNMTTVADEIDHLQSIAGNMHDMNRATSAMAHSTNNMQYDMGHLNRSISGPMSMMPWNMFTGGNNFSRPLPPPPAYYNHQFQRQQPKMQAEPQPAKYNRTTDVIEAQVAKTE